MAMLTHNISYKKVSDQSSDVNVDACTISARKLPELLYTYESKDNFTFHKTSLYCKLLGKKSLHLIGNIFVKDKS